MTTTETKVFNSPTASATRKPTYSPQAMKLAAALNERQRVDPIFKQTLIMAEFPVERPDKTAEGKPKAYYLDVGLVDHVTGLMLGLEAMGDGSKSDDIGRHNFLIVHGIIPVYIQNHDIDHAMHLVLREIRMKLKLLRMVVQ